MSQVSPIPEGFHSLTPHIVVKGAADAIAFYREAFGAEEVCRMSGPGGGLMHAELRIGNSPLMLADENPMFPGFDAPKAPGASPVKLHLYVEDCDAVFKRAVAAGATPAMEPADMFWGDRYSSLICPFGHVWNIATHKEDVTPEVMGERAAKMFGGCDSD
ncbi:MAG: VOC family protein [Planctomycetes bacterium]|nr:VOC family protein [Planctomycetota bacterium]